MSSADWSASIESTVADEIRAYARAPLGLLHRAASFERDATVLDDLDDREGAAAYREIAARLRDAAES